MYIFIPSMGPSMQGVPGRAPSGGIPLEAPSRVHKKKSREKNMP